MLKSIFIVIEMQMFLCTYIGQFPNNNNDSIIKNISNSLSSPILEEDIYHKNLINNLFAFQNTKNMISICLIFLTLFLILVSSILLLLYDIYQDKKNFLIRQMPEDELRNYIFKQIEHLRGRKLCRFAWYISYYQYPVIDIFTQYTHDHPRFIRFFTEIVIMLLSLAISLLPYTFEFFTIDYNLVILFSTLFVSFCASLFARLCMYLAFSKVNNHSHMKEVIWNPIKNLFKDHIYNNVKKDILLNDNWHKIKMRILAINCLCGKFIQKSPHGKMYKYFNMKKNENMQSNHISINKINKQIKDYKRISNAEYKLNSSFEIENKDIKENKSDVFPLLNSFDDDYEQLFDKSGYEGGNKLNIDNKGSWIIQHKYSFTISKDQLYPISYHTIRRFREIASKYIYNGNNQSRLSMYIIDDSSSKEKEWYTIEQQDNYSYFTPIPIEDKDILKKSRKALRMSLIVIFSLVFILGGIYTMLYFTINITYPNNHLELVLAWLLPSLAQIFILGFLFNYIRTLFASFLLFNLRKWRKRNRCIRFLYKVFVDKFMIDMFKLRNLITKYHREFSY